MPGPTSVDTPKLPQEPDSLPSVTQQVQDSKKVSYYGYTITANHTVSGVYKDLLDEYDSELKKGDKANQNKIIEIIHNLVITHLRDHYRMSDEEIDRNLKEMKWSVGLIKQNYESKLTLIITVASSIMTIVGGVAGLSHFAFSRIAADTAGKISGALTGGGTGGKAIADLLTHRSQGDQSLYQHWLKQGENKESLYRQKVQQEQTAIANAFRSVQESHNRHATAVQELNSRSS